MAPRGSCSGFVTALDQSSHAVVACDHLPWRCYRRRPAGGLRRRRREDRGGASGPTQDTDRAGSPRTAGQPATRGLLETLGVPGLLGLETTITKGRRPVPRYYRGAYRPAFRARIATRSATRSRLGQADPQRSCGLEPCVLRAGHALVTGCCHSPPDQLRFSLPLPTESVGQNLQKLCKYLRMRSRPVLVGMRAPRAEWEPSGACQTGSPVARCHAAHDPVRPG